LPKKFAARQLCWHEIRRRRKSEGGQKFLPPQPPSFLPARAEIIKIQRPDFRGKKFGLCSRQTASKNRQKGDFLVE